MHGRDTSKVAIEVYMIAISIGLQSIDTTSSMTGLCRGGVSQGRGIKQVSMFDTASMMHADIV
jgi:hypothetical protein